jgi:hypothetical protein
MPRMAATRRRRQAGHFRGHAIALRAHTLGGYLRQLVRQPAEYAPIMRRCSLASTGIQTNSELQGSGTPADTSAHVWIPLS